jgi:PAS domain S-box-containing protein
MPTTHQLSPQRQALMFGLLVLLAAAGMFAIIASPADSLPWLHQRMLGVHLSLELVSIIVAALVVAASWHTFDQDSNRNTHVLLMGFTVVLVCDLQHALTYAGMPKVLADSTTPRAIFFWLMGRSAEVLALAAIALGGVPRLTRKASLLLGGGLALALTLFGNLGLEHFPQTFVEGSGVTSFKAAYEHVLTLGNAVVALLFWRRASREGNRLMGLLGLSSGLMAVGGFAYTSYVAPSDFQNIAGHLYKVAAYLVLYQVTFATAVTRPYQALKASENQVRESRERLSVIGANLPNSVLFQLVMGREGERHATEVSDSVQRVLGFTPSQVLADVECVYSRFHPDDKAVMQAAEMASANNLTVFDREARYLRPDGATRRLHFISAPRRTPEGNVVWEGICIDVTERREAEESNRRLEQQLFEAQKMESIGTLASGIAHDFNNVLAAILGNSTMALEDVKRGERQEALESLEQIRQAGLRARSLVNQILSFSRRQAPLREVQPLRPIVDESMALLRSTLPAQVELVLRDDAPEVCAKVDRTQLEQVLINLCTNAWQAMGEAGGRIEVVMAQFPAQAGGKASVRLSVIDNGCGMDTATRQHAFEPFFTTKPMGQGTGLGLAVVQRIVHEHEGRIALESTPGVGTRFDIELPAVLPSAHSGSQAVADEADAPRPGRGQRVVYVDDEPVVSFMVNKLLQRAGYQVTCLGDAREAMALLQRDPFGLDVLVTDYRMPGHSGLELIQAVRRLRPDLPTMLISGHVSEALREAAQTEGVNCVLEKQQTIDELVPHLDALMRDLGLAPASA